MTVFITILLIVATMTLILYPYFGKADQKPAVQQSVSAKNTLPKNQKALRKTSASIDDEIEKRIRDIRSSPQLFCPECGKKNKEGSKFCTYCGAKLRE